MKKVVSLFLISLIAFGVILIALTLSNKRNDVINETILSVNRSYFYSDNNIVNLRLYSNSNDSFLNEYQDYEAYLFTLDDEQILKVEITDSFLNNVCFYDNNYYYEYILRANMNASDIHLDECNLRILSSDNKFEIKLGSINYYDLSNINRLDKITNLYALSFSNPFSSVGAIYLNFTSDNKDLVISDIKLPDGLNLGALKVNQIEENSVDISSVVEYSYLSKNNGVKTLETNEEINNKVLFLLNYENDILYDTFPILFKLNGIDYAIETFDYMRLNDLNLVAKLITSGDFSGTKG